MKAKFINESLGDILQPKSKEQIISGLKKLSNEEKNNLLINAAHCGRKDVVELLLNNGADVNAKSNDGWSALTYAARNGRKDVVELLLNAGTDINAKDNYGWSALMYAVAYGHKDVVELLKRYGAKE